MLDVGGWHNPFNLATHVLDIMPYQSRRTHEALDPEDGERFPKKPGWFMMPALVTGRGLTTTSISRFVPTP